MQTDYSLTERLNLIVDILAEGVLALSAGMNFLDAFDRIKIKDIVSVKIVPSTANFAA